jgi:hypothetical protein
MGNQRLSFVLRFAELDSILEFYMGIFLRSLCRGFRRSKSFSRKPGKEKKPRK